MKPKSDDYKPSAPFEILMKYLGIAMSGVFVFIGVAMIAWRDSERFDVPPRNALILGFVCIIYGLFRGYRVYRKYYK